MRRRIAKRRGAATPWNLLLVGDPPADLVVDRIEVADRQLVVLSFAVPGRDPRIDALSAALREVALRILAGDSNAEIARRRGTSVRTVANQIAVIFRKLAVGLRRELVTRFRDRK